MKNTLQSLDLSEYVIQVLNAIEARSFFLFETTFNVESDGLDDNYAS